MNNHKQSELIKNSLDELRKQEPGMLFLGLTNSEVIKSSNSYLEFIATFSSNVSNNIHTFSVYVNWNNDTWNYTFIEHYTNSRYYVQK